MMVKNERKPCATPDFGMRRRVKGGGLPKKFVLWVEKEWWI